MSEPPEGMGILPVDKPVGPTSHDMVARARGALGVRRIGHTGTLDPFASGLLLLCVAGATRLAEYFDILPKTYEATAVLGRRTATDDHLGETIAANEGWRALDREEVRAALDAFRGTIRQVPPSFSAKKVGGEAVYLKARRGETVELPPVQVRVDEVELLDVALPEIRFRVRCSTGTYIRAIARDLGEALGTGAHLSALRRTAIGPNRIEDALPAVALGDPEAVRARWIAPLAALAHLPAVEVDEEDVARLVQGRPVTPVSPDGAGVPPGGASVMPHGAIIPPTEPSLLPADEKAPVAIAHEGRLVAIAFVRDGALHPRKVFVRG